MPTKPKSKSKSKKPPTKVKKPAKSEPMIQLFGVNNTTKATLFPGIVRFDVVLDERDLNMNGFSAVTACVWTADVSGFPKRRTLGAIRAIIAEYGDTWPEIFAVTPTSCDRVRDLRTPTRA